ncbi:MAG: MBL fold metallo-hydrolase [Candidatus Helarchaeota archaeon]
MKIFWITHACFQIITNDNKVIYFDPYQIGSDREKADIILASHDHYDHADKNSIANIIKDSTIILCPTSSVKKLKGFNTTGMEVGDTKEINGIKIIAVRAYNVGKSFHPKQKNWLGYIVEVEGKRIYHAGDTDLIDEMKNLGDINVAMIPVGDTYTMDFKQGIESLKYIKPKICLPMHQWDNDLNKFKKMAEKEVPDVKVELIEGKSLEI